MVHVCYVVIRTRRTVRFCQLQMSKDTKAEWATKIAFLVRDAPCRLFVRSISAACSVPRTDRVVGGTSSRMLLSLRDNGIDSVSSSVVTDVSMELIKL
jgi:hypothetical protein